MKLFNRMITLVLVAVMMLSVTVVTVSSADVKLPFTDVKAGAWYEEAVKYCYSNNYVSGTTATAFSPSGNLTRAQFVTLLANISGADLSVYENVESGFNDVKPKHWFHKAVTWAAHRGYVSGTGENTFSPNAKITREQLARIFYVYSEMQGYDVSGRADLSKYTDASKISSWAKEQVSWAVSKGIINGMTATTVVPRGNATRAQAAQIIMTYTKLDLTQNINRFRAFTSKLDPYITESAARWGLYRVFSHNVEFDAVLSSDATYNYNTTAKLEFSYFGDPDVLTFRYIKEVQRSKPDEAYPTTARTTFYGAIYQGKSEVYLDHADFGSHLFETTGSFDKDKYTFTLDRVNLYSAEEATAMAESLAAEILGIMDTQSKNICGYRFMSVVNAAPEYDLDAMSPYDKLLYSLPVKFDYYTYDISTQSLEHQKYYKNGKTQTETGTVDEREYTVIKYLMATESFVTAYTDNCYYYDNAGVRVGYESTTFNVYLDEDQETHCSISYSAEGGKLYYASVTVDKNNEFTYKLGTNQGMTQSEIKSHLESKVSAAISYFNAELKPICGLTLGDF